MIKVWTNAAKAELLVKPPESIVHQPHPPVAGSLIDGKRRMPGAEAGMASLFDISLRPPEPTDQEISEALLGALDIPHRVHGPQDFIFGDLLVEGRD